MPRWTPPRQDCPTDSSPAARGSGGRFRRLAAALFVFAALGTALPAAAQTVITLISNTGQANSDTGSLSAYDQAQAFTTGANASGYTITGIDIQFGNYTGTASYTVSIWTEVSGSPGSSVASLTSPSSLTALAFNSYTTSGIDLAASTTYFVHVDSSSADNNFLQNTTSSNEDSGGQSNWSIADGSAFRGRNLTGAWDTYANSKKILIKGYAKANTNTAPTVANPIPNQAATAGTEFSYAFLANTFSDVDNGDTLTYTATKADGNDLPTWLGFTGSTRTFSGTPQAADVTTVAVKVMASDGNGGSVSDEFNIVVSAASTTPAHCDMTDTNELWCATLTVGTKVSGGNNIYGYSATGSTFGSVAPDVFPYRTATIWVSRISYVDAGSSLKLNISRDSGTTPLDGLLGTSNFSLEIGTGGTKKSFAIDNPGAGESFAFASHGLSWTVGDTVAIKLKLVTNTAPTVANAIPDQRATAGTEFSYAFLANTFNDVDGDALTYTATKADGAVLPTWLDFAPTTRIFSGMPQAADVETVAVKVTASDGNGGSVSDEFNIVVSAAADTTAPTLISAVVQETGLFVQLRFSENVDRSNLPPVTAVTVTAGGNTLTITDVVVPAVGLGREKYWVIISPAIRQGEAVVVSYTDPSGGNDANAFQDTSGNDAASFRTGSGSVPAATNGSTLTNNAPTVANAIPDQRAVAGTAFSYAFLANTFNDVDNGDTLTYTATKADGNDLPMWLGFTATTRTFKGTPQAADVTTVAVKVTASDGNGGSVSDEFDIVVRAAGGNNAPMVANEIPDQYATVSTTFRYAFPDQHVQRRGQR